MCIGIPCRITERDRHRGWVEFDGNRMEVVLSPVPDASVGDWVLVHAGLALCVIREEEAEETRALLEVLLSDE
jgi:hydrogenase expression/formation protein HypC